MKQSLSVLSNEELFRHLAGEMITLSQAEVGVRLDVAPEVAFAVVAMCQLGLRHPTASAGASAPLVEEFIEYVRAKFEPHAPAIAEAIRRGNNPQYDDARPEPSIVCPKCGMLSYHPKDIEEGAAPNWPPDPPELRGLNQEQRRFYRLIEERDTAEDGLQEITLACGHRSIQVIPIPDDVNYMQCAQCISAWVEAERQDRR